MEKRPLESLFQCSVDGCKLVFTDWKQLLDHARDHISVKPDANIFQNPAPIQPIKCPNQECNLFFTDFKVLLNHIGDHFCTILDEGGADAKIGTDSAKKCKEVLIGEVDALADDISKLNKPSTSSTLANHNATEEQEQEQQAAAVKTGKQIRRKRHHDKQKAAKRAAAAAAAAAAAENSDKQEEYLPSNEANQLGPEFLNKMHANGKKVVAQEERVQDSAEYVQASLKNLQEESDEVVESSHQVIDPETLVASTSAECKETSAKQQMEGKKLFDEKSSSEVEDVIRDGLNEDGIRWESGSLAPSTSGETHENESEAKPAEIETVVPDILLEALKKIHACCYLEEAVAVSTDESAKQIELLTSQLSFLCAGFASKQSSAAILKIAKAGVDYALTDAPLRLSFLASVVINFASELEKDGVYDISNYLQDRTGHVSRDDDSWLPYYKFLEDLREMSYKKDEGGDEEEDTVPWELPDFDGEGSDFEEGICEMCLKQSEGNEGSGDKNQVKNSSQQKTGREGEELVFHFLTKKFHDKFVTWMNGEKESGLAFDIRIDTNETTDYVEVKSTTDAKKKWFYVSWKEYDLAVEKGASYIFARAVLSQGELIRLTMYRNPAVLLKSRKLKLAVHHKQRKVKDKVTI